MGVTQDPEKAKIHAGISGADFPLLSPYHRMILQSHRSFLPYNELCIVRTVHCRYANRPREVGPPKVGKFRHARAFFRLKCHVDCQAQIHAENRQKTCTFSPHVQTDF